MNYRIKIQLTKRLASRLISLSLVFSAFYLQAQQLDNARQGMSGGPTVRTAAGALRGVIEGNISIYKGIPYAAPPVGDNRWQPPQRFPGWKGVRDATKFGADCAQAAFRSAAGSIATNFSEECLFLNIWVQTSTTEGTKLPVMVWIHGGAFVFGSGSQPDFFGVQFAKRGVILVTFNYRLGRLGFFAFPALSKDYRNGQVMMSKRMRSLRFGPMDQQQVMKTPKRTGSTSLKKRLLQGTCIKSGDINDARVNLISRDLRCDIGR